MKREVVGCVTQEPSTHTLVAKGGSSRSSPAWAGSPPATVMIVGSAGAHETQAVAVKVTAKRVTARAVTPTAKVTDVATVQQADGTDGCSPADTRSRF